MLTQICNGYGIVDTGTSQEARDEKEKTEAFSRLHQGKNIWLQHRCKILNFVPHRIAPLGVFDGNIADK